MIDSPFLIAGGGIAGLAAALGLAKSGREPTVFERAAAFQELGAGVQLGPNAVAALQWLDAWEGVAPHCCAPSEIHVRDGRSGKLLQRVRLGKTFESRFGMPYRVVLRSGLLQGLLDHARASAFINLETSSEVEIKDLGRAAITVSGASFAGEALIAADGVHSAIRVAIQAAERKRRQSHTLYRKLLPREAVPPAVDPDLVTLWMCAGGHLVHYMVDGGRSLNIVASVEEQGSGTAPRLSDLHQDAAAVMNASADWLAWPGYDLEPDPRWSQGRTVLIGDAAHAMLPYLAQGAAMALEDACVLAQSLDREPDVPNALGAFSRTRFPRVSTHAERRPPARQNLPYEWRSKVCPQYSSPAYAGERISGTLGLDLRLEAMRPAKASLTLSNLFWLLVAARWSIRAVVARIPAAIRIVPRMRAVIAIRLPTCDLAQPAAVLAA